MSNVRRGPVGLACRRCLDVAAAPTAVVAGAAAGWHAAWRPDAVVQSPGAGSAWLGTPIAVAVFTVTLAAIAFWPTFAEQRAGRAWVERLQRGPLAGVAGAVAGALAAVLALALPLALLLAPAFGAPAAAHAVHALTPAGDGVLDAARPRLLLHCPTDEPVGELRLQPLVGVPTDSWQATRVRAFADGVELPPLPHAFADNRQGVRVPFAPRRVRTFELAHDAGGLPLAFDASAAVAVGATPHGLFANAACLGLVALVPAFLGLALAALVGRVAPLATTMATGGAAVFLATIGGQGPFQPAVVAVLRGEWLATATHFRACMASLAVGAAAMILAMVLRGTARR